MVLKSAEFWSGIGILIFAGLMFVSSFSYELFSSYGPGPGLFPRWLSGLLILLSLMFLGQSVKSKAKPDSGFLPKGKNLLNIMEIIGSMAAFILMVPFTGYIIANITMMIILMFRKFKWYWSVGISVFVTAILYTVFQVMLQIQLPAGIFGR